MEVRTSVGMALGLWGSSAEEWFAALAAAAARVPGPGEDFPEDDDEALGAVDHVSMDP